MSNLHILIDVEQLTIQYLLDVPEVTALVDDRIGSRKDGPYPRVTVTRIGGSPGPIPAHLDAARLTIEAWDELLKSGGTKKRANEVARTVQAAMYAMVDVPHEDGVVTDVQCVLGPSWVPDPVTSRPRYVLDFIVRVHPVPVS